MRLHPVALCLLIVSASVGCDDASMTGDDGGAGVPDADGGPPAVRQIAYTPEGCGYEVQTPEVMSAAMGEDAFDDADPGPVHVHVSWAGPSDTSFALNWESAVATLASSVVYGTDRAAVEAADDAAGDVLRRTGHTMFYRALIGGAGGTRLHEVHVCGLEPSTTYYYKVGGPGHWSAVLETATAPPVGSTEPFAFGVTGDSRNNVDNAWPIGQRRLDEAGVDFEVFTGDAVLLGTNQGDWRDFFEASVDDFAVTDFLSRAPLMLTNGNHDDLAVNYVAQFAFPQDVSPGEVAQGEEWYSFDYGNAHFVVLNDTVADNAVLAGAQADWLRADLAAVDRVRQPWIFVNHHRGFYSCHSTHSPDTGLRAAWQPIFDEYAVDLVLTGHNHVYERSVPIRGLDAGEGVVAAAGADGEPTYDGAGMASGTIYVVAGGAGAPLYDVGNDCPTSHLGIASRVGVVIEVDGRTLRYTATDVMTGATLDSFTLIK